MPSHPQCAAKLLVRLTGGDPESVLGYEPTEETPRTNTYVLLANLLDTLTEAIVKATDEGDNAAFDAAADARDALILVYADALRSQRFAEAVWLHIATRDTDAVAEATG